MAQKVWFVTGASKGLGLVLVKKLLEKGYRVAATSRSVDALAKAVGSSAGFLPLAVDLTSPSAVAAAVGQAVAHFGSVDVVVNNAGFGQVGALEELEDAECRGNFDINVFGLLNVVRSVMPFFRAQQSGYIFNISSIAGVVGNFPGWGIYCATKFAVNGLSEALREEVKELGVKVVLIQPGYFRTDFLGSDALSLPRNPIAAYEVVRISQKVHQEQIHNNQPGDPEKAALVMIELALMENPPLRVVLGSDAYKLAVDKVELLREELLERRELSLSTDYANSAKMA